LFRRGVARVLDVGCGTGKQHTPLRATVHLDLEVTEHNRSYIDVVGDGHRLPFRDSSFDLVHASHVLEHLERPLDALREFARVAPRACIVVPNLRWERVREACRKHIYSWTPDTLKNLLLQVYDECEVVERRGRRGAGLPLCSRTLNLFVNAVLDILGSTSTSEIVAVASRIPSEIVAVASRIPSEIVAVASRIPPLLR